MEEIKELSPEQINESLVNNDKLEKIKGAENIIIQALNTMKNQSEPNIIQAEDIYPELWIYLLKETIEVVDNMEKELTLKVKDIIKRTAISETTNPILKKSLRPTRESGDKGLFIAPKYLELSSIFENRNPEEVIDAAIGKCLNNDPNNVYNATSVKEAISSNIKSLNDENITDIKSYLSSLETLRTGIIEGSIHVDDMKDLIDHVSTVLGAYPAIDILYTIFVPDYKLALYNIVAKNAIVNNMVQTQLLQKAREEAENKEKES